MHNVRHSHFRVYFAWMHLPMLTLIKLSCEVPQSHGQGCVVLNDLLLYKAVSSFTRGAHVFPLHPVLFQ